MVGAGDELNFTSALVYLKGAQSPATAATVFYCVATFEHRTVLSGIVCSPTSTSCMTAENV